MKSLMAVVSKTGKFVLGFLALVSLAMLQAGNLEPPAAPGPTMKTLDQILPTWSVKIDDPAQRFVLVLDGAGVLDRETGLVWEKITVGSYTYTYGQAGDYCMTTRKGTRGGWRLPTYTEACTLMDGTGKLPVGHPFTVSGDYWTNSKWQYDESYPIIFTGNEPSKWNFSSTAEFRRAWCVRGGN